MRRLCEVSSKGEATRRPTYLFSGSVGPELTENRAKKRDEVGTPRSDPKLIMQRCPLVTLHP